LRLGSKAFGGVGVETIAEKRRQDGERGALIGGALLDGTVSSL
jgi:hypothetical protein